MSDMAELYKAWNEDKKQRRRERYESANPEGWEQHNENHWHRTIDGKKLNYWPSTGLVMIGRKRHNINSKHIQSLLARQRAATDER